MECPSLLGCLNTVVRVIDSVTRHFEECPPYREKTGLRIYTAIIERCQDTGLYVGFIPGFEGAHTQAETLDKLSQKSSGSSWNVA